jgi:hypothetical protein
VADVTASSPITDILDAFTTALAHVAEVVIGDRELSSTADFPRYVIVPIGGPLTGKQLAHGKGYVDTWDLKLETHCHGADYDAAYRLFQALRTLLPQLLKGRSFGTGDALFGKPAYDESGVSIVLPIVVRIPIAGASIPASGADQDPTDAPTGTVTLTNDGSDPTAPVSPPGDGTLEGSES